jgi:hypothetical protein
VYPIFLAIHINPCLSPALCCIALFSPPCSQLNPPHASCSPAATRPSSAAAAGSRATVGNPLAPAAAASLTPAAAASLVAAAVVEPFTMPPKSTYVHRRAPPLPSCQTRFSPQWATCLPHCQSCPLAWHLTSPPSRSAHLTRRWWMRRVWWAAGCPPCPTGTRSDHTSRGGALWTGRGGGPGTALPQSWRTSR